MNDEHARTSSKPAPRVMLSFDVEEFDLPNEYGADIPLERQLSIGASGLATIVNIVDQLGVRVTLFTTARMGEYVRSEIPEIARKHEIASHGVRHDRFDPDHYTESKRRLEALAETEVTGFRMARLQPVDVPKLIESGYRYDSSENPIRLPGRYDNRHLPREARMDQGLVRVPISTSPGLRIPLFWLGFRHLPGVILKRTLDRTLRHDGYLNLFFHPWEFLDTSEWSKQMPRVVNLGGGDRLARKLAGTVKDLTGKARFTTLSEFTSDFRTGQDPDENGTN